jgi:hypothetical protein
MGWIGVCGCRDLDGNFSLRLGRGAASGERTNGYYAPRFLKTTVSVLNNGCFSNESSHRAGQRTKLKTNRSTVDPSVRLSVRNDARVWSWKIEIA